MKRRTPHPITSAFAAVSLSLASCGIPQEEHDKALADQKAAYDAKMAEAQQKLTDSEASSSKKGTQVDELQKEVTRLGGDLTKVMAAAESLEAEKRNLAGEVGKAQTQLASTQKNLEATQDELNQLRKQREQAEKMASAFRQLATQLKSMIDSGKLSVAVRKGRMTVNLPDDILFPSGSAELKKEGVAALNDVATVLKQQTERDFLVSGHTDDVPIKKGGKFQSNWDLSTARAVTVVKLLTEAGVDAAHVAAAGFAHFDPVKPNDSKENKAKNRRIEIILMPRIDELPVIPEMGG
ncbi:MAG: OmpA family protein [Deltaproteobacteria bacterium]|nr:OmpA family protein [Deltaproteobacteria bacterium]